MISRKRPNRKETGGLYKDRRKRRLSEKGGMSTMTLIGKVKRAAERVRGGSVKQRNLRAETISVHNGKKVVQATMENVLENTANRNFVRRNILTKGTVVKTDKGNVKITSRPGQQGSLSGVLVK